MDLQTHIRPELWAAIASTYRSGNYSHAIVTAMHHLSGTLRERAGVDGDGSSLAGQALGGQSPRLRINKLQTRTERDIQTGVESIVRGLFQAIRNPRSHEITEDSKETADAIIYFIDYLLTILGQSEQPFTLDRFLSQMTDPLFAEIERYAELLISEIPAPRRGDVAVTLFRKRIDIEGRRLELIVPRLLDSLPKEALEDFMNVVSGELDTASDPTEIRSALQCLRPGLWSMIRERTRIRIENKVLQEIRIGAYDDWTDETQGSLGIWARDYVTQFSNRSRVLQVIGQKLRGDSASECSYVARYFLRAIPSSAGDAIDHSLVKAIACAVSNGHEEVRNELRDCWSDYPPNWRDAIMSALKDLWKSDPDYLRSLLDLEDIPF